MVIDHATRWPEASHNNNNSISVQECACAFCHDWVVQFGVPLNITSDKGSHFTSSLWSSMCDLLGIDAHHTMAHHPESNGMVERFHRTLKSSLHAKLADSEWFPNLPLVMLLLHTTPKDDIGSSSAELTLCHSVLLPSCIVSPPSPAHVLFPSVPLHHGSPASGSSLPP